MKNITVFILGMFLVACSSTQGEVDNSKNLFSDNIYDLNTPNKKRQLDTNNVAVAALSVALATTIGSINNGSSECSKDCEKELKKYIENRTKNKDLQKVGATNQLKEK
jgi:triphosphoribosyl-dephospho-CoA synthetase